MDRNQKWRDEEMAIAYGLLWLFQGDSDADPQAKLVFSARKHLRNRLTVDECSAGIIRAREIADALGVSAEMKLA